MRSSSFSAVGRSVLRRQISSGRLVLLTPLLYPALQVENGAALHSAESLMQTLTAPESFVPSVASQDSPAHKH